MLKVKNMLNENARRLIHLQERANRMIDFHGFCTEEVANELEELSDNLTFDEIDAICEWHLTKSSESHIENLA